MGRALSCFGVHTIPRAEVSRRIERDTLASTLHLLCLP